MVAYAASTLGILSIVLCSSRAVRITGSIVIGIFISVNTFNLFVSGQNVALADVMAATSLSSYTTTFVSTHLKSAISSCLLSLLLVIAFCKLASKLGARLHQICLLTVPFALLPVYATLWSTVAFIDDFPSPVRIPMLFAYNSLNSSYSGPREEVKLHADKANQPKHIIYIVDESIRGDMISINDYPKDTTPFLRSVSSSFLNFGITNSITNISSGSNIALISGLRSDQCPDINQQSLKNATIFQYAQAAGYQTYFLDAQCEPGVYANFMRDEDFKSIDHTFYSKSIPDIPHFDKDSVLAEELIRVLKSSEPSFVYLNKYGGHPSLKTRLLSPTLPVVSRINYV